MEINRITKYVFIIGLFTCFSFTSNSIFNGTNSSNLNLFELVSDDVLCFCRISGLEEKDIKVTGSWYGKSKNDGIMSYYKFPGMTEMNEKLGGNTPQRFSYSSLSNIIVIPKENCTEDKFKKFKPEILGYVVTNSDLNSSIKTIEEKFNKTNNDVNNIKELIKKSLNSFEVSEQTKIDIGRKVEDALMTRLNSLVEDRLSIIKEQLKFELKNDKEFIKSLKN